MGEGLTIADDADHPTIRLSTSRVHPVSGSFTRQHHKHIQDTGVRRYPQGTETGHKHGTKQGGDRHDLG